LSEIGWLLSVGLIGALLLGLPVAFALGGVALAGFLLMGIDPIVVARRLISGTQILSLLAIPGFLLAGEIMRVGGLTRRLVRVAVALVGHVTGGLSMATAVAGTFFGAISGSAPATTAAVGSIMPDEMEKRGYSRAYAAAICTGVGPIGQMIPPSIPMIIWGVLAEESITRLFLAGMVPGLLAGAGFILVSYIYGKVHNVPRTSRATLGELMLSVREGFWALLTPFVILGGIYTGVFTPTEASMVAVVYSLFVSMVIHREMHVRDLWTVMLRALRNTANVVFIIAMAAPFAWLMSFEGIPVAVATALLAISDNPIIILLILNIMLLVIGSLMDNIAAMIILSTVLTTMGAQIGIDPTQLGALIVVNFAIGMTTPPIGYALFVGASVTGVSLERITVNLWPFFLVLLVVLGLVTYVPAVTLALPALILQ
jgi:tripartite ATP-independent transporter DctM subunit